ncbi:hypothetical protein BV25DRAFT_1918160 [Artomyces pyxidatus]|uniref:Uncharacterized protein n=1 Tax=Artomyces pyxidatus TaxID=48021 RepID=A0ACB8SV23_9AGAM|nr:hypothetical protein BV25DRAFT_1918160 [Artomyces pyxidatus]
MPLLTAEYEPLTADEEDRPSESWSEKPPLRQGQAFTPLIFWSFCTIVALSIVNYALFPRTAAISAQRADPFKGLPVIDSSPGLDGARAKQLLAHYAYASPAKVAQVDAHDTGIKSVTYGGGRMVVVSAHENTVMEFPVPSGNASACSIAFFRPPIAVTSTLSGALKAVEVWEVPAPAVDAFAFRVEDEKLIATLDLTRQAAMAASKEFDCGGSADRTFEIRCPNGASCEIQYSAVIAENSRIGFQLRR